MKPKIYKIYTRELAIRIASLHNRVPIETAKKYTDSELTEVLRQLGLVANFQR